LFPSLLFSQFPVKWTDTCRDFLRGGEDDPPGAATDVFPSPEAEKPDVPDRSQFPAIDLHSHCLRGILHEEDPFFFADPANPIDVRGYPEEVCWDYAQGMFVRKNLQLGIIEIQCVRVHIAQGDLQTGFHDCGRDRIASICRDQNLLPGSKRRKPLEDQNKRRFAGGCQEYEFRPEISPDPVFQLFEMVDANIT
jgi:hypothetical protein